MGRPAAAAEHRALHPRLQGAVQRPSGGAGAPGQIDLALAALESVSPKLTYELIEAEVIGILAGSHARLADKCADGAPVTLDMAGRETFVCLKEGHSVRVVQGILFRRYGLTPHILLETDSLQVARRVALSTGSCMLCSNIYVDDLSRRHGAFYPSGTIRITGILRLLPQWRPPPPLRRGAHQDRLPGTAAKEPLTCPVWQAGRCARLPHGALSPNILP